jgi:hypothetical protein
MFLPSAHGAFASVLFVPIAAQLVLGVYLKLHINEGSIRPWAVRLHGVVGKAYPVLGWTQMLFGLIAYRGYCRGDDLGQCLAHYIMGSGFIAYGVIIAIMLLVGEAWVIRSGRSPEWWDSWVIMLWGIGASNPAIHLLAPTRYSSQYVHGAPRQYVVRQGHAAYVSIFHAVCARVDEVYSILGVLCAFNWSHTFAILLNLCRVGWRLARNIPRPQQQGIQFSSHEIFILNYHVA